MSTPAFVQSDSPSAAASPAHRAGAPLVEQVARCGSRPCRQRPAIIVGVQLALTSLLTKIGLDRLDVDEIAEATNDDCVFAFIISVQPVAHHP